jgi:hypothetical protein
MIVSSAKQEQGIQSHLALTAIRTEDHISVCLIGIVRNPVTGEAINPIEPEQAELTAKRTHTR